MPTRPEFRGRCRQIRATSNIAAIRQVLGAADVQCNRYVLAAQLDRRGFRADYIAAWIQDRLHKDPRLIYRDLIDSQQLEQRPSYHVRVGPDDATKAGLVGSIVSLTTQRLAAPEPPQDNTLWNLRATLGVPQGINNLDLWDWRRKHAD